MLKQIDICSLVGFIWAYAREHLIETFKHSVIRRNSMPLATEVLLGIEDVEAQVLWWNKGLRHALVI